MDKKSEHAVRSRSSLAALPAGPDVAGAAPASGWWMYHGDPAHTGFVSDSPLTARSLPSRFSMLHTLQLGGPVISVPAISDGFVYTGVANYLRAEGGNGGALHKIDLRSGSIVATFWWDLGSDARDAHSFAGMGSTPAVVNGRVYFGAFDGKFYCLDQETLRQLWVTDLRNPDPRHHQPITNLAAQPPPAVIWSSPVVSADGQKLYVGCGEGENPALFSFVFCIDCWSGDVRWIFCTNQFTAGMHNEVNQLPYAAQGPALSGYTWVHDPPVAMGASVWGSIAYDEQLGLIYCPTGNQQPEPNAAWQRGDPIAPELPGAGYSNGLLALDAEHGGFRAFFQVPPESNYRPSDTDVDVGGSPVLFTLEERRLVGLGCKNGAYFVLDAPTLELLRWRQMLPYNDGQQIPEVDRHPDPACSDLSPWLSNEDSNATPNENFSGAFNTAAVHPGSDGPDAISARLFVALGGPNYHSASPGIDSPSTPFMRALDAATLEDAWPLDHGQPQRYLKSRPPMYANVGESGLSSPAVVNDVVFCSTSKVALYAFDVRDGTLLWEDDLGLQTDGYNGGYGYCLGPAIWKSYVVAGALIAGRDGGVLRIYGLSDEQAG